MVINKPGRCRHEPEDPGHQEGDLVHCHQSQDHRKDHQGREGQGGQEASSEEAGVQGDREYLRLSCSGSGPKTDERESFQ